MLNGTCKINKGNRVYYSLSIKSFFDTSKLVFELRCLCVFPSLSVFLKKKKSNGCTYQKTFVTNFIHTWSVESEFVIEKSIFPWTSKLAWIWNFWENWTIFGYFWAVFEARNPDFLLFNVCSVWKNMQYHEILIKKTNPDILL